MTQAYIDKQLLDDFRKAIKKRLALELGEAVCDVEYSTNKTCKKFNLDPKNLLRIIDQTDPHQPVVEDLIVNITVGETYFFRDDAQMKLLQDDILPKMITRHRDSGDYHLKIWSAGCSSGEEIYTIAMLLLELVPDIQGWKITLLGTDINVDALHKAYKGIYTEWSMRSIPQIYKTKYFSKQGKHYHLGDNVRRYAKFEYLNLADLNFPSIVNNTINNDLILCRNVILYFSHDFSELLMSHFERCLNDNGCLLLGASDPVLLKQSMLTSSNKFPALLVMDKNAEPAIDITVEDDAEHALTYVNDIMKDRINTKPEPRDAYALSVAALNEANQGHIKDSIDNCMKSMELDPTNKLAYYVYALNLADQNNIDEAESAFKRALFLDRKFISCLVQYGHFLLRNNRHTEGVRMLISALKIAGKAAPDDMVEFTGGITYSQLAETLEKELTIYGGGVDE